MAWRGDAPSEFLEEALAFVDESPGGGEVTVVEAVGRNVTVSVRSISEYRRHFPDAFRKRFQSR